MSNMPENIRRMWEEAAKQNTPKQPPNQQFPSHDEINAPRARKMLAKRPTTPATDPATATPAESAPAVTPVPPSLTHLKPKKEKPYSGYADTRDPNFHYES